MRSIRIDRCVCYGRTFSELREVADAAGVRTLEELRHHASFGTNCGLCHPYVRRMLRTGETVFRTILRGGDEM